MLNPPLVTPKITDRPVREPASEWASSTLDALVPISSVEDQIASNPTTPGLHVPGAFPDPYPKAVVVQQDIQYVKDAAVNALQTAKGYVPTSVEDVKRLIENTGDTVGGYLPPSVTAYLPHHTTVEPISQDVNSTFLSDGGTHPLHQSTNTSLPSEETSQNTHLDPSGGAGILPGPPGELGVAALPDELSQTHGLNSETFRSETGVAILPEERRQQNLPSHDDDPPFVIGKDSTGGVGALPGDKEEVGLALLPEERKSLGASTDTSTRLLRGPLSTKLQDRDISLPATGSPSFSPLPNNSDKNTTASSTHASHPTIPNTTARMYPLASDGVKFKGVPLSQGFQKELDQEQLLATKKSIDERRNLEQGQNDMATAGHGAVAAAVVDPSSHTEVSKRPGFMDKLKGEVKVISGILSHKESKVQEGRKMMGRN